MYLSFLFVPFILAGYSILAGSIGNNQAEPPTPPRIGNNQVGIGNNEAEPPTPPPIDNNQAGIGNNQVEQPTPPPIPPSPPSPPPLAPSIIGIGPMKVTFSVTFGDESTRFTVSQPAVSAPSTTPVAATEANTPWSVYICLALASVLLGGPRFLLNGFGLSPHVVFRKLLTYWLGEETVNIVLGPEAAAHGVPANPVQHGSQASQPVHDANSSRHPVIYPFSRHQLPLSGFHDSVSGRDSGVAGRREPAVACHESSLPGPEPSNAGEELSISGGGSSISGCNSCSSTV